MASQIWITIGAVCLALMALVGSAAYGIYLWRKRDEYTRERFAFAALAAMVSLTTALVAFVAGKTTPWHLIRELISGSAREHTKPSGIDYLFLLTIYVVFVYLIKQLHENWTGLK